MEAGPTDMEPRMQQTMKDTVIRERQTQTTVRYHFATSSMPVIEVVSERMWEVGTRASLIGMQNSLGN